MDLEQIKKYIIENNLIKDLLIKLGCHSFMNSSSYIRCALPNDNDPTKVSVNPENLTINIFTKGKTIHGDIFNLIMYIDNIQFSNAYHKCCQLLNINPSYTKIKKQYDYLEFYKKIKLYNYKIPQQQYYDTQVLKKFNPYPHIDLIKNDGIISLNTIKKYNVMFDERTDRIIFPHFKYDDKNKIVGIIGRTVNKAYKELKLPKYLSLLNDNYEKKYNLYGLSHNIEEIKKRNIVVVFEAEKSVLKSDMYGYPIGVSVGCHEISFFQKMLLLSLDTEICIAFDKDVQMEHILDICKQLNPYRKVSYIYDKYNLLKEKDSPVDRGYKRWEFLFRNRIIYREE